MASAAFDYLLWRRGIPREWLFANLDFVGNYIRENGLRPLQMPGGREAGPGAEEAVRATAAALWPGDIRGGIRIAHLHHAGQVYILNERQWADFSGKVMQGLTAKLGKVQKVGFEQLMEVADAVEKM